MATYAADQVTPSGISPNVRNAAPGGDKVPPDCFVRVMNGGPSPITATMDVPALYDGDLTITDRQITVPNGSFRVLKATRAYSNRADGGLVSITWSATTSVTFEVTQ